jgi:hypothetical protein
MAVSRCFLSLASPSGLVAVACVVCLVCRLPSVAMSSIPGSGGVASGASALGGGLGAEGFASGRGSSSARGWPCLPMLPGAIPLPFPIGPQCQVLGGLGSVDASFGGEMGVLVWCGVSLLWAMIAALR